ncbi:MAG: hypothetical protein AXA67_13380 [Methylothermaceae bacteria B42]|nr:MAG: hypothetical protein AXA67_13380 [Methylothermaceae bacteria B42]HHJ38383.1 two-component sensor histidine kinase [Methylothermaceae bacterium]
MKALHPLLYRPVIITAVGLSLLLVLVLVAFILLTWRNLARIHRIETTVSQVNRLQTVNYQLQKTLPATPGPALPSLLEKQLKTLATQDLRTDIESILNLLHQSQPGQLTLAYQQLQHLLEKENLREQNMLTQVVADTELELKAALGGLTALLLLLILGGILTRYWLLTPLRKMNGLLLQLAEGRFEPIMAEDTGPPWRPLLDNYNYMVTRLAALEKARQERTRSLESQVRSAAATLLAQSRTLARAERLAAVGEVAAGVAHELRNPLAGIQMALHNLRSENTNPEVRQRFDLIIAEMERLSRHLNQLLDQARHQPEPLREIDLDRVIEEILALLQYQIPGNIQLHYRNAGPLRVHLPETTLRQSLINLILNAVQALGKQKGNIWITAQAKDNMLRLEVSDDGPGFPKDLLSHGIRPFTTGKDGGTGLGLLMVKRFVTSLDGRILLGERQPRGAHIILEIPCATPC